MQSKRKLKEKDFKVLKWEKKGIIFAADKNFPWMCTHAQVPFSVRINNERLRIYFSTREAADPQGNFRSYSGFIDVNPDKPTEILDISREPIIKLGDLGEFDEFGSMAGSIVKYNNEYYLYYCGWTRAISTPYNWAIGLAKSTDGKSFTKIGKGPLLGPTPNEPYLQACPIVFIKDKTWHMFYLSGKEWLILNGKKESKYLIMHATSVDGVNWLRDGDVVVPPKVEHECQTSSSIFERDGYYHMLFSYRHGLNFREDNSKGYRIGYAYSTDLNTWHRDDSKAGLEPSSSGWDSEMVAYPHITKVNDKTLLFYCGNYFGKAGFGYAELKE